jgi:hypothetical protein
MKMAIPACLRCVADHAAAAPVCRVYNERYVASAGESASLVSKGWTRVGVGFCAAA